MVGQGLTVQLSKESVAKGDSFIISGVAAPNSSLNVLIIGPKGGGSTLIDAKRLLTFHLALSLLGLSSKG
jgi:hypothetical protein